MKRIRIAEDLDFTKGVIQFLRTFADVHVEGCKQEEVNGILQNYDIFWFRLGFTIGAEQLGADPRCKVLATPVTGIDHIDERLCAKLGVQIVCLKGEYEFLKKIRATAELTIALTFDLIRHTARAQQNVLQGNWQRDLFRGQEIYEKRVGIIGYGRLGAITASFFEAFGAEIYYTDVKEVPAKENHTFLPGLEEVIERCDIISLHVNYNSSNHHMISREILANFTNDKILINTSRGGLIDENALLECLKNKSIKGVALDVVQNEHQWSFENPLLDYALNHSNLIITPHIGGNTYESFEKTEWFIARKIQKILSVN